MEGKIEKLEEIRSRVEGLDPKAEKFPGQLKDLSQEALGYFMEPDDQQEINWTKNAIEVAASDRKGELDVSQRDKGLSYLKEALNAVIIREQRYMD